MNTNLICPDCGGVIGGDLTDGRRHCQCDESTLDDTEVEPQPAPPPPAAAAEAAKAAAGSAVKKICCQCGKDVTHAKRAKDARGYWCYECHRNDLRRERFGDQPRARCPQCGRMVPAESITTYHGNTLCSKCLIEQEDLPNHQKLKYRPKLEKEDPAVIEKKKKRTIILISIFVGALVVITILKLFRVI